MRKMFKAAGFVFFGMLSFTVQMAQAQNNKLGGWELSSLFYQPTNKTVVYAEIQSRSQTMLDDFFTMK